MPTLGQQIINLGPMDLAISLNTPLPAAGANTTTGIIDLQSIAPNGDSWRQGRFGVVFPNLPENTAGAGITVTLQAAPPSLVAGASVAAAPLTPPPAAFVTPAVSQVLTVAPVANGGSVANIYYFTAAFDANGSPYQFYQFVIATPAQVASQQENILIAWVEA